MTLSSRLIWFAIFCVFDGLLIGCRRDPPRITPSGVTITRVPCANQTFLVAEIDLKQTDLQLLWKDSGARRFANFDAPKSELHKRHRKLVFATNAGIFDPTYTPLGLHIEDGRVLVPLNRSSGSGNFYLKPNGVFLVNRQGAQIVETEKFIEPRSDIRLATQSGPMLVIDGAINPLFPEESPNRRIRNGVGVGPNGQVYFALSTEPVTFHALAVVFRDSLKCRQALYLDGVISRFYPIDGKSEQPENFAGILAATVAE